MTRLVWLRYRDFTSGGASDASENRSRHQSGAARIVEIEQATDEFTGGIEARYRLHVSVQYLTLLIDAQTAESKSGPATNLIRMEGWLINCVRPIGLVDGKRFRAPPILHVGIKWYVAAHRGIVTDNFA
jgi:hypothetical protein